ncbi:MAG: UDP-N-acetylmuramoyl-L-alanyl-D-glutamate--2,6-diaminopimelate ligase [Candidatus Brocadiaceae bacterium]
MRKGPVVNLHELLGATEVIGPLDGADPEIRSVVSDSRRATEGSLFVAIDGTKADGHDYIPRALENGAAAIVCERPPSPLPARPVARVPDSRRALSALADAFYGSPSRHLRVTGITGTDGKTSTTEILRAILSETGTPAGSIGTLGYWIDGHWLDSDLTTPDPVALHESFRRMVEVGIGDVCMEVSSHSLIQSRVADVAFEAAVLTNITRDHLNAHGTRQNYARAKRMLFEQLEPDAVAVLPAESEFLEPFREATRAEVLTYGMQTLADVRGRIMSLDLDGMELLVQTPFELYSVRTTLIGSYNCLNILAAATVAFAFGLGGEVVKEALRGFRGVPGRLEKVRVAGRHDLPTVAVDYAHTPDALRKVLTTLRPLVEGRLVCVVGCGGDRDRTKRPLMGGIAAECADAAVFTADNSRSERTEDIIEQMLTGVSTHRSRCRVEPDRRKAIELGVGLAASPDSMVVVCGKGCERHLDLGEEKMPFDDRVVAREILHRVPLQRRKTA